MHILPVIDLKGGLVVRGVAGRRDDYRPLVSPLCGAADPALVAGAFAEHFGLREVYLADLDAIAGAAPAVAAYQRVMAAGARLWVDAGLRQAGQAAALAGVHRVVAGSETLDGPEALARLVEAHGPRVVFSLDLRDGRPLASGRWPAGGAAAIARRAVACGVARLIVLDVARVGTGTGAGTEGLLGELAALPAEVYVGGGARGREDLARWKALGAAGALVASALHDGRLSREDLASL